MKKRSKGVFIKVFIVQIFQ